MNEMDQNETFGDSSLRSRRTVTNWHFLQELTNQCWLTYFDLWYFRKIVELEEELRVVGNNLKSLEVSEEKVSRRSIPIPITINTLNHLPSFSYFNTNASALIWQFTLIKINYVSSWSSHLSYDRFNLQINWIIGRKRLTWKVETLNDRLLCVSNCQS